MVLENKLGITDEQELAREDERLSKMRAVAMFDGGFFDAFEMGAFSSLGAIHEQLFWDVYEHAGELRPADTSRDGLKLGASIYLIGAINGVTRMRQSTFEEIVAKLVEISMVQPFSFGNGRAIRLWFDAIMRSELNQVVDWRKVDKDEYLALMDDCMENERKVGDLLRPAVTDAAHDRETFLRSLDASYAIDGLDAFKAEELPPLEFETE